MNAIVGTGKRGKAGAKALGIAGIVCLAIGPALGTTAAPGAPQENQSLPPGANSLAEQLDQATRSLPVSQPTAAAEEIQVDWGTGEASKLSFVTALVDHAYFEVEEGTPANFGEATVAGSQIEAVLAALVEETAPSDKTEVLLGRINLDTEASSAGDGHLLVAWGEEPAPDLVLARTMSQGEWTVWTALQVDDGGESTAVLELEAVAAVEILVIPADLQAAPWIELQTAVRPVANALSELLPVAPVDPEAEEDASEKPPVPGSPEPGQEIPGTEGGNQVPDDSSDTEEPGRDGDEGTEEPSDTGEPGQDGDEGTEEPSDGEESGQEGDDEGEQSSGTEEPAEGDDGTQDEDAVEEDEAVEQDETEEAPEVVSAVMTPLSARALSTQLLSMANAIANWKPGFILSDAAMYTSSRMTEAQIKTFIETVGKNCKTTGNNVCLKDQTVTNLSLKSDFASKGWGCNALTIPGTVKSWTAIKRVADACSINPEVLLVFIQKESSGLTQALSRTNWNKMMGVGCPDNQGCNPAYSGFTNQLYYSADWLGSYRYRGFYFNEAVKTGKPVVVNNSSTYGASCGTQTFVMQNQATASLYTYNPAVPTKTALESWPGVSGLKCDSYGQRNVYMMMLQWFPNSMQDHPGGSGSIPTTPTSPVTWESNVQIGNGWPERSIFAGDWTGNGQPDMMLMDSAGRLLLYEGQSGMKFAPPRQIGKGWNGMDWVAGGVDWDGDGNNDLVARHRDTGLLYLYRGDGRGGFAGSGVIGNGWGIFSQLALTQSAGKPMIYAITGDNLRLYAGTGSGGFRSPVTLGAGWSDVTAIAGVGDWSGDRIGDVIVRDRAGRLYFMEGASDGSLGPRSSIGQGWAGMKTLGSSDQSHSKSALWTITSDGKLLSYGIK